MRNLLLGLISSIILFGAVLTLVPMEEAESLLAIPPTSAFSTFLSDTFGVNISAVFSTDSATFSGGDLTFFPGNKTINFGPNATALFEQLNSTLFSLNGSVPVLIAGDQIDLNTIGNLTEISLEDCIQDEFLLYDSGSWSCVDVGSLNGTGGSGNLTQTLTDVYFNAEEGTVDDLSGVDCVNDVTYSFFDNTDPSEYARQVIEFCGSGDIDDNVTWLYVVPQLYNMSAPVDFDFNLFWTDDTGGGGTFVQSVTGDANDAEEDLDDANMDLTSSDLELHLDTSPDDDYVGMRWTGVTIPNGANITNAEIQFHVDAVDTNTALNVRFYGDDVNSSSIFTTTDFDISSRTHTTAFVNWTIPAWLATHDEGAAQLTPDLSSIIQEIVDRPGWVSGNDLSIFTDGWVGTGERTAEAFDGEPANSPEISISFTTGSLLPVCFEFSLLGLQSSNIMDGDFTAFETVCTDRSGIDQLSITEFSIQETDHMFRDGQLVFFKIVRPDDFVVNDFEGDVFLFGAELKWQN